MNNLDFSIEVFEGEIIIKRLADYNPKDLRNLIAAAPELLEAVKDFLSFLKSDYEGSNKKDLSGGMISYLEALITKAGTI